MAPTALDASNYTVCACLAAPHLLYAYIWFFPQHWRAAFKQRSVEAFETVAWLLKGVASCLPAAPQCSSDRPWPCDHDTTRIDCAGIQFLSVAYWYLLRRPSGVDVTEVPPLAWPLAAALVGFGQVGDHAACACTHACVWQRGRQTCYSLCTRQPSPLARPRPTRPRSPGFVCLQWLNVGIFQAIGHAGVYYGFKLGHTIPWVDGFPFNLGVPHPQYVGSVATVVGMAALVSKAAAGGDSRVACAEQAVPCLL